MRRYRITIGDKAFEVEIVSVRGDEARVLVNGRPYEVKFTSLAGAGAGPAPIPGAYKPVAPPKPAPSSAPPSPRKAAPAPTKPAKAAPPAPTPADLGMVLAPMPGSVLDVLVKVGDGVQAGDTVAKLEAMKMENDIRASISGVITEIMVKKGDIVAVGDVLLVISEVD
jgi:biotin carboxyl carrier protein